MSKKLKKRPSYASEAYEGGKETEEKGLPVRQPKTIGKKKHYLKRSTIIGIVIAAVLVLGLIAFIGYKDGWYPTKDAPIPGKMTMEDYAEVEIVKADVEVSDEEVQTGVDDIITASSTAETLEEGVVEDGDSVNIDYAGRYKDTGEAFEGGTAQGASLEIGSGTFIEGFEEGLIGKSVGETVSLNLTFPEDYHSEELAGKDVIFDVTINSRTVIQKPELTDEFVKTYSETNMDETVDTIDALKEKIRSDLYEDRLKTAMDEAMEEKITVEEYDETTLEMVKAVLLESAAEGASSHSMEQDQYAKLYGYDDIDSYVQSESERYLKTAMWVDKVAQDEGMTWTGAEVDKAIKKFLTDSGQGDVPVKEYKKLAGEGWLFLFRNLEFKHDKVLELLKSHVKLVDEKEPKETEINAGLSSDPEALESIEAERTEDGSAVVISADEDGNAVIEQEEETEDETQETTAPEQETTKAGN